MTIRLNVNALPRWDKVDVWYNIQRELEYNDIEYKKIVFRNYQIEEEDNTMYYELYESEFFFEKDMTYMEFYDLIIENEKMVKSYKTLKGLLNNCVKSQLENNPKVYNIILEL